MRGLGHSWDLSLPTVIQCSSVLRTNILSSPYLHLFVIAPDLFKVLPINGEQSPGDGRGRYGGGVVMTTTLQLLPVEVLPFEEEIVTETAFDVGVSLIVFHVFFTNNINDW